MALFKKRIERTTAVNMFIDSVLSDSKATWPTVVECISQNGFKVNNEDEGFGLWLTGLLAIDTIDARKEYDDKVANLISNSVGYYFDFRIEELKDWPPILREMYDFNYDMYLRHIEGFIENPIPSNLPPARASLSLLLSILSGYKNTVSIPYDSPQTLSLARDFSPILMNTLGRWGPISKQYKVKW